MADNTKIEWADATLNYVNGCSVLSPGCTNCYAMKQAHRFDVRRGLTKHTKGGMVWTGEVRENPRALDQALAWRRGRKIFWNAHGDLFHDSVPNAWIDKLFAVCALTPQHTHMILTKRSARMREYFSNAEQRANVLDAASHLARDWKENARAVWHAETWPLPNVWLGVSVEDQQRADERIPDLLATPAAVRFISAEPLLGPIDLTDVGNDGAVLDPECWGDCACDSLYGYDAGCRRHGGDGSLTRRIDWVIAGGESGPGARPMHPDWVRSLRDQCEAAGVAFHFKQWGDYAPVDHTLIPTPRERQAWAHKDGQKVVRAKCEDDITALEQDERRAGEPLYSLMLHVGKKRAGRLLDGRTHDDFPAQRNIDAEAAA